MQMIWMSLIIDGREHGMRSWPAVPRSGDFIVVRFDGAPENVEVVKAVWGRHDGTHDFRDDPTIVSLHCKRLT
ncbi:MAG: hypothetical protein K0U61_02580 [Alphaproteobacteria bacterium]|nr:hypothetical protein [Alphaproteobacteria bacterium]